MAEAAESFTDEERRTLAAAARAGRLSREQKLAIIERNQAASDGSVAGPPQKPTTLRELTGGVVGKDTFTAVGAIGGAALGTPAGPVGFAAGGALGAAGGSAFGDNVNNALRAIGVLGGEQKGVVDISKSAINEAALDVSFTGFGRALRPIIQTRRLGRRILGLSSIDARALANEANSLGIGLGAVDVGGAVPKGFAKVVGIFPFTGTPLRTAFVRKQGEAIAAHKAIINSLAPNAHLGSALSVNMTEAAINTRKEFVRTSGRLYTRFRQLANAGQAKIPTDVPDGPVQVAKAIADDIAAKRIALKGGDELGVARVDEVGAFIAKLSKLPETINIKQYQGLVQDLQSLISKGDFDNFDVKRVVQMKTALENSLNALTGPQEVKQALASANKFYSEGIVKFQTPTAQKFLRTDKRMFSTGAAKPGTINRDDLTKIVVDLKSPEAVRDLRALVGDDLMSQAAAKRIQDAGAAALETIEISGHQLGIIDPKKFANALGISTKKLTTQGEGLQELLKGTGYSVEQLQSFVKVLERIEKQSDASQFVKRRVTLGGVAALGAAVGFGGAVGSGGISVLALVGTVLARKGSTVMASPQSLNAMITVLDENAKLPQVRIAAIRLLNVLREDNP